ncbi:unnamed protein product [Protopolystoma xenopodis]|uniref:Uncharacterized protein n=1 Tax=Protopolystoma xenopodis TaxID=117903 RepID=A0A3S5ABI4_9PLAT|nr:unnamed protein product [Protopolystoma xenopodis]
MANEAMLFSSDQVSVTDLAGSSGVGRSVLNALARCFKDLLMNLTYSNSMEAYIRGRNFRHSTVHNIYLMLLNQILDEEFSESVTSISGGSSNTLLRPPYSSGQHRMAGSEATKAVQVIFAKIYWAFLIIVRSKVRRFDYFLLANFLDKIKKMFSCFY